MGFRFGIALGTVDAGFAAKCRRAEELGYDVISIPDHLGAPAPFPSVVAAAAATERMRVGTFVLNVPFYNPALLARDIQSTSTLTGGRFELGVGSGHMKSEFDDAGLPWWPSKIRIGFLAKTLEQLRERVPDLPPLLIGGHGEGMLSLAAQHADIVGFSGIKQVPGKPPGTFEQADADELGKRVAFVRDRAEREQEYNMLIQGVVPEDHPYAGAPQVLTGSPERMAEELLARSERYGFTYYTVLEPSMEAFAPVIDLVRPRPRA
ncbi:MULTISPECIES: TIGR03621 family F420-dependent LLM class oxidoreductase [Amycolatopsis]|uniref:TIGR03621 family F420-dependent LLM class oxidoreductase n=1 Tax=Amycolatopsis dongchuanensis TaxID=1070866 RepID=A0ABP8VTR4_9PSEU